jgi:DNA-binding CsgD family transcriptional regulator
LTHAREISSQSLPRIVGAAVEVVLGSRGSAEQMLRVFGRSPVPMVIIDGDRRYVEVNRPARLIFRLSLAEMRRHTTDDLTPRHEVTAMEAVWARLLDTGSVAGRSEVAGANDSIFDVVYCGVANALPGLHLLAFAPAGWPEQELSAVDDIAGDSTLAPLTPREREVLQLAAEGLSGPSIANRLVVSPATVKTHFSNLYRKLGVSDRTAAVARGLRFGLID